MDDGIPDLARCRRDECDSKGHVGHVRAGEGDVELVRHMHLDPGYPHDPVDDRGHEEPLGHPANVEVEGGLEDQHGQAKEQRQTAQRVDRTSSGHQGDGVERVSEDLTAAIGDDLVLAVAHGPLPF